MDHASASARSAARAAFLASWRVVSARILAPMTRPPHMTSRVLVLMGANSERLGRTPQLYYLLGLGTDVRRYRYGLCNSASTALDRAVDWRWERAMISLVRLCRMFFSAAVIAATPVASSAQRIQVPLIDVDCSAYQRQDGGTWTVL